MKAKIKRKIPIIITSAIIFIVLAPCVLFALLYNWLTAPEKFTVKTEYGDEFLIETISLDDIYTLYDANSDYWTGLDYFCDEEQFHSVCDNEYITCYNISDHSNDREYDSKDGLYIIKIKEYDEFFDLRYQFDEASSHLSLEEAEKIKSVFLCDELLMDVSLNNLDHYYHDEMLEVKQKLLAQQYDDLGQYGLTKEMAEDTESLEAKIKIMKNHVH